MGRRKKDVELTGAEEKPVSSQVPMEEQQPESSQGLYFDATIEHQFIHTGSTLLDCVLGGGYVLGRIANIVGDRSTGKSLLALEGFANFHMQYPSGKMLYIESESAFSHEYARSLGAPIDDITVLNVETVEGLFHTITKAIDEVGDASGLFIVDSLDALSDEAELERDFSQGSFGAEKAKKMSQLFRRLVQTIEKSKICLIFISQIRDNMNAGFGKKTTRAGGRALDFYCTHIIHLNHVKRLVKTVRGVKRAVGAMVKASCEKNKIGLPFRNCEFDVLFSYGIRDGKSCLDWMTNELKMTKFDDLSMSEALKKVESDEVFAKKVAEEAKKMWIEIDKKFLPTKKKYGTT